ncbi:MAG: hypothetical protein H0U95_12355 [Bacteroidetes bacterium]|nr:hypothetical protein [Bacteroidota bacterium]
MKTFGAIILVFIGVTALAQDTLYTTKGKIITGQVTEITQHEIKYKRAANPDGPLYVVDKTDIVLIHYKNGSKEVFENSGTASKNNQTSSNQNNTYDDPVYVNTRPNVNVVVAAPPVVAFAGGWGWGWGGWGWNRPYCGGYYRNFGGYHSGYYHGGYGHHYGGGHHGGHYGHRR